MKEKLLEKIESLNEMEKYQEIIDLIEALPAEQLNTELMGELGRAYNNIEEYEKGLERYEEAIEILLKSRQISLDEEDVVDGEDFELASCYVGIGDKENAQKYLDSARDSITERGLLNDYMKEKIEEIEKEISSLDTLFN